ncbi:winged helix-turn-helix domain-containing protein [Streptomyces sp. NBC_01483]|nr:winged helix-turn-helix domain-containing protein [Streptomyces sp. NBC_01483]
MTRPADWGSTDRLGFNRPTGFKGCDDGGHATRPAAYGRTGDQVWTPARVRMLIGRKFHISYSVSGVTRLPHPMGCGVQMPGRCTASFRRAVRRHSTLPDARMRRA